MRINAEKTQSPAYERMRIIRAVLVLHLLCAHVAEANAYTLFGAVRGKADGNLRLFPQWTGSLARGAATLSAALERCNGNPHDSCTDKDWHDWNNVLVDLKGADPLTQLRAVNEYINRRPYVQDRDNWGAEDYWAAPSEFLRKGGDCEEYAIAKYVSLRRLGWRAADLQIVIGIDFHVGVRHAILVADVNGEQRVLDNQVWQVVRASNVYQFFPQYALNEMSWWSYLAGNPIPNLGR